MAIFKCKMCGGELALVPGSSVCTCEYCGTTQTVPSADNEKKMTLFARANRILRDCEFDKAAGVFESIVADFPQEAEAYWGLVLCKYGIEYVDDPATGKKVPTCHRSSFESVMDDANYQQAVKNADTVAKDVYRAEGAQIEELRRDIIAVSSREEPYDVFICYKETDENGERTEDSVLAQDAYDALTEKGYRVFFSRITLEDKLGVEFEPHIFAALNSAKIMLAFGTDYERYEAVWVKNEWSRFLQLIAKGEKKTLIPCYKGMKPEDMPKEFTRLQAQNMGKLGAMQDLVRGVEKILPREKTAAPVQVTQPEKAFSVRDFLATPAGKIVAVILLCILIFGITTLRRPASESKQEMQDEYSSNGQPEDMGEQVTINGQQHWTNSKETYVSLREAELTEEDYIALSKIKCIKMLNVTPEGYTLDVLNRLSPEAKDTVESITLSAVEGLDDIEALSGFSNLKELTVMGQSGMVDVSPLSQLTSLEKLNFGYSDYYSSYGTTLESLEFVRQLENLKELHCNVFKLDDLSPLENLTNLTILELGGGKSTFTDTSALKRLTNLETLALPGRNLDATMVDLSGLSGLTALKSLQIDYHTADLTPLSGLTALKTLKIRENSGEHNDATKESKGFFESLEPLRFLSNLETLYINLPEYATDLTPLGELSNLRDLSLQTVWEYKTWITDISPLGKLSNLTKLYINFVRLYDVSVLTACTKLQSVSMRYVSRNTDLSCMDFVPDMQISKTVEYW